MKKGRIFLGPILTPCSPAGPIPFTSPWGSCLGITSTKMLVSPLKLWKAEVRVSSQPFPLLPRPLIIHPRQHTSSAWTLGSDRVWAGLQTSRTHNSPSKSCYPSLRTDRRVLMMSEIRQLPPTLVIYRFPRFFHLPKARSWSRWKAKRGLIKYGRLCASHVQRCDGNRTVVISWPLWAGKERSVTLESIKDFLGMDPFLQLCT